MAIISASTFTAASEYYRQPLSLVLVLVTVLLSIVSAAGARPAFACAGNANHYPFCRANWPIQVRVRDLISRLTLAEKIRLLVNNAAAVPRLGIQGYEWWSEALHGVSNVGPGTKFAGGFPAATSFPQVILTAASFNQTLWEEIGRVVSDEARAMYNGGTAGLTYWSPNVNIFRDPRWGRGQETPGEDPFVAAKYAASYVKGLQQIHDGNRLKVAACCKHFTAYDLDHWHGVDRFHFNAKVSKQDLEDTYNVPFKACVVEGRVASVMCSYNQVNGVPTCADPDLLKNTIRGAWHLNGYIVSDCDSVGVLYNTQHYTSTPEQAAAYAIKAGLDLDCGPFLAVHTAAAVRSGLASELDVNNALVNTLTVQMRLGMFDGEAAHQTFGYLGPMHVCSPAHQQLALEAARQGIVLLKNDRGALPLSRYHYRTIAVIGPNSDATVTMIGNYAGVACKYTSPLRGIGAYAKTIHQVGCTDAHCLGPGQPIDAAAAAARGADATVLVVGLDQSIEAEFKDRVGLLLPGRQQELVAKVAGASRGPTILVIMSGGPIDVTFAKNNPRIASIIWVGYPGQEGGRAIADVVFGAHNPGGKLPVTWYPQEFAEKVPMTDMAMRPDPRRGYPGRTYRFYKGPVVYPFGHGLSYTQFAHSLVGPTRSDLSVQLLGGRRLSSSLSGNSTYSGQAIRIGHAKCDVLAMAVEVDVKNMGEFDGSHTMMVYATPPDGQWADHGRKLVGFHKVHVPAKAEARVVVGLDACKDLSVVDNYGITRIPLGLHHLHIGDLSHSISVDADAVQP